MSLTETNSRRTIESRIQELKSKAYSDIDDAYSLSDLHTAKLEKELQDALLEWYKVK